MVSPARVKLPEVNRGVNREINGKEMGSRDDTKARAVPGLASSFIPDTAPNERGKQPPSPDKSRPNTSDVSALLPLEKTKYKTPQEIFAEQKKEYDDEILRLFKFVADNLARNVCSTKNTNYMLIKQISKAKKAANEKMEKSPLFSMLRGHQYDLKFLDSTAKFMSAKSGYPLLYKGCVDYGSSMGMQDRTWVGQCARLVAQTVVEKYDIEESLREKGLHIAAAKLQSAMKGLIWRRRLRMIWLEADRKMLEIQAYTSHTPLQHLCSSLTPHSFLFHLLSYSN